MWQENLALEASFYFFVRLAFKAPIKVLTNALCT